MLQKDIACNAGQYLRLWRQKLSFDDGKNIAGRTFENLTFVIIDRLDRVDFRCGLHLLHALDVTIRLCEWRIPMVLDGNDADSFFEMVPRIDIPRIDKDDD